jgi:TRAP-type C4-dicarboxylate transport system substrate-binding protein
LTLLHFKVMDRRSFVLSALALAGNAGAQDKPEIRLSTATGPAFSLGKAGERWSALLNERAAGAFEVRQYPGATLAGRDALREFGALRDGAVDMAVGSALAWSAQLPAFGVYGLPWIAPEPREQEVLAGDAAVRERVQAAAASAGVVVVAIVPLGERVIATFEGGVTSPASLAGRAIRTVTVPMILDTLATLGGRPASMPLAEAQAQFASRLLDGQEGPASTLAAARVAASGMKFVTRWGAFADAMVFAVRQSLWSRWTTAQQDAARAASAEAAREAGALAREDSAFADLGRQGVDVVRPAPAQRAAFRAAVEPVWAKWTASIGAELVAAAQAAVKS